MKFLKEFTDSALSLIKKNADDFGRMMKEIDFSVAEKKFNELETSLKDQISELKKRFKELTDRFIVEVPFDKEKETLSFKIENGIMVVTTEYHDENRNAKTVNETTIPEGVDVHRMIQKYDEKKKVMCFIFLKKVNEAKPMTEEIPESEIPQEVEEAPVNVDKVAEKEALIKKMIQMHESGISYRKIAEATGISDKTVKRWIKSALKTD